MSSFVTVYDSKIPCTLAAFMDMKREFVTHLGLPCYKTVQHLCSDIHVLLLYDIDCILRVSM